MLVQEEFPHSFILELHSIPLCGWLPPSLLNQSLTRTLELFLVLAVTSSTSVNKGSFLKKGLQRTAYATFFPFY